MSVNVQTTSGLFENSTPSPPFVPRSLFPVKSTPPDPFYSSSLRNIKTEKQAGWVKERAKITSDRIACTQTFGMFCDPRPRLSSPHPFMHISKEHADAIHNGMSHISIEQPDNRRTTQPQGKTAIYAIKLFFRERRQHMHAEEQIVRTGSHAHVSHNKQEAACNPKARLLPRNVSFTCCFGIVVNTNKDQGLGTSAHCVVAAMKLLASEKAFTKQILVMMNSSDRKISTHWALQSRSHLHRKRGRTVRNLGSATRQGSQTTNRRLVLALQPCTTR
jgi:hypothetical protein